MTTRIPISADPSGVVSAFEQIRQSIKRAGQEGREFSKLDMSHPELEELAEDIRRVHANFETLKRLPGTGIGKRIRTTEQEGRAPWELDFNRLYGDPAKARQAQGTMGRYIFQGTGYESRAPAGAASPMEGALGKFAMPDKGLAGLAMKGGGILAGLAGIQGIVSALGQGTKDARQIAIENDAFLQLMRDSTQDFDKLRESVKGVGDRFGILSTEATALATSYAKAANALTEEQATRGADTAIGFGRGFGIAPERVVRAFGAVEHGAGMPPREFAMLLGETIASGGMFAKGDEVMSSIAKYVEQTSATAMKAYGLEAMMGLSASLYRTGADENMPGLQGAGTQAIIESITQALRSPGSEAQEFSRYRALAAGGVTDPFEQHYLRGAGPFASPREILGYGSDESNLGLLIKQVQRDYGAGNPFARWAAIQSMMNLQTPQQAKALEMAHERLGDTGFGDFQKWIQRIDIEPGKINESAIHELTNIFAGKAGELAQIRDQYIKSRELTPEQRAALETGTGETLRADLAKIAAEQGKIMTEGERSLKSMVEYQKSIADHSERYLPMLSDIQESVAAVARGATWLMDYFGGGSNEEPKEGEPRVWEGFGGSGVPKDFKIPSFFPSFAPDPLKDYKHPIERLKGGGIAEERMPKWPDMPDLKRPGQEAQEKIKLNTEGLKGSGAGILSPELRKLFSDLDVKYGAPAGMTAAIARVESNFNPRAVSPAGAQGMFQIMPATAAELGVNPWNPIEAAEGAMRYMRQNVDRFGGSWEKALAAYNGGPTRLANRGENIAAMPLETRRYVPKVLEQIPMQRAMAQIEQIPHHEVKQDYVPRENRETRQPTTKAQVGGAFDLNVNLNQNGRNVGKQRFSFQMDKPVAAGEVEFNGFD